MKVLSQRSISVAFMNMLESIGRRFCGTCPWLRWPLGIWKKITSTMKLPKSAIKDF